MLTKKFNYDLKIWTETDGTILSTGCDHCGQTEKGNGWYSFDFETTNGYYKIPSQQTILQRMKYNRTLRNTTFLLESNMIENQCYPRNLLE